MLLRIAKIPRSTYYEIRTRKDKDEKNSSIMNLIREIYNQHNGNYGYKRITLELRKRGVIVNHKKVLRLTRKMGLLVIARRKSKYSSYKGSIGLIADNHIKRNFEAVKPNQKWFTDITEFNLRGERIYLSPILDAYGRYIVTYNISKSPNLNQIQDMLNKAFEDNQDYKDLIFHSDQGWQYQHYSYQKILLKNGVIQSMSRKGNSIDNGLMEGFFGILKREMFYGKEKNFKTIDELIVAIKDYINYYNNNRIKLKFNGLTPIQYRNQYLSKVV